MNNDSPPSPPAPRSPEQNENENENNSDPPSDSQRGNGSRSASRSRRRRTRKAKTSSGLAKKLQFMTHLLKSLDSLIFAELAVLYYMECSFIRFVLRAVTHFAFLTPKSDAFPMALRAHPSHVISILLPNTICILCHLFMNLPRGSESMRGYLHGGILIDFIGQKPPTTRLTFLALDIAILGIQCLMLAIHSEREALRNAVRPHRTLELLSNLHREFRAARNPDDEERGVSTNPLDSLVNETVDIEMRPLGRPRERDESTRAEPGEEQGESSALMAESTGLSTARRHLTDLHASGNAVLGEFHILQSLRIASTDYSSAAAHSIRTLGYATTLAGFMAQQTGQPLGRRQR